MENLNEIYQTLRELELCDNQKDFSANWLGKSEGYFAHIQCARASASATAIGMLCTSIASSIQRYSEGDNRAERSKLFACMVTAWTLLFRQMRSPLAIKAVNSEDLDAVSELEPSIPAPRRWIRGVGYRV